MKIQEPASDSRESSFGFDPAFPLERLRPASYNPRRITDEERGRLRESISAVGFVKPIVTTPEGLLIAGHQRTDAAKALGLDAVPAYVIATPPGADEIRFNQLHNGCEVDVAALALTVPFGMAGSWVEVPASDVRGGLKLAGDSASRQEILRLLAKYGPFSSAVATIEGDIIAGQVYASACKILGMPLLVRYIESAQAPVVQDYLSGSYGRYSYDHLPKTTWGQSLAQMHRLKGTAALKSTLWERCVLPNVKGGERILDFGCGFGAYIDRARKAGFDAFGLEFYRRTKDLAIDVARVQRDITTVLKEVAERGRFDVVVCDSVLNSVDSLQAEQDVLATLNAFTKPGGRIYFSGRSLERQEARARLATVRDHRRYIAFLDDDGFSAIFRSGIWQYQKFHTFEQVSRMAAQFVGPDHEIRSGDRAAVAKARLTGGSWQVVGSKQLEAPWLKAVAREFNLPLPSGSYGRSGDAVAAIELAISRESPK